MFGGMFMEIVGSMTSMMEVLSSGFIGMGTFMMMLFEPMLDAMGRMFGLVP